MNQRRPPDPPRAATPLVPQTFTGNRALANRRGADLRNRPPGFHRRRSRSARTLHAAPRRAGAQERNRPARPVRARDDAPLRPPVAEELRHRYGALSARLVHDEAQSAPQRENGAPARLCRHPSAPADLDRPGRAGADGGAGRLAAQAHRHGIGGADAQGRRAWRNVRHDGDQGRHCRAGRRRNAQGGAGARIGAWHQSRHRRRARLFRARDPGRSRTGWSIPRRSTPRSARTSPRSC